jgi:hypothetical protein
MVSEQLFRKRLIQFAFFAVVVFIITLLAVYNIWLSAGSTTKDTILVEVVKAFFQLSIVIIIGGLVTAFFKYAEQIRSENLANAEHERQKNRARYEIRVDYLLRLGSLYRVVKSARRSLRAVGLTTKFKKPPQNFSETQCELYKEEMQRLDNAQLDLEALKIEAENLPDFVKINGLSDKLGTMEDYLRSITREYEEFWPTLDSKENVLFAQFKRLNDFTGKKSGSPGFKDDFSAQYYGAIESFKNHWG